MAERGDTVLITATFKTDGVVADPTSVTAYVRDGDGRITSPDVTKLSVGIYTFLFTYNTHGTFHFRVVGEDHSVAQHHETIKKSVWDEPELIGST